MIAPRTRLIMSGGRNIMDRVTESLLNEFVAEHELQGKKESARFEHFAAYITTKKSYPQIFNTMDLVTGKGDDTGVDSIAILVNNRLITDVQDFREHVTKCADLDVVFIFVQAETSSGFDASKIGTFGFGVLDFFKESPSLPRNDKIQAAADIQAEIIKHSSRFRHGNPLCRLYYVTTGKWQDQPALIARMESVKSDLLETDIFRDVEFIPLGSEAVQKLYRQTKNAISREFNFTAKKALPEMEGVKEAYLGYLSAQDYLKIISDENGEIVRRIFYDNVRDWLDATEVNNEIRATIASPAKARFALMNNGITIIARTCIATGDKIYIENFSVVNGCQTSYSLHAERANIDSSVMVPIRLISTQNDEIINDIIKATNRQTPISPEQFYALEEFSKELEEYFTTFQDSRKLFYERREEQYSMTSVEKTRIVTPPNMIKAYAAMFRLEPHRATRNYAALKASVGQEMFVAGHRLEAYYVAAFTLYKLEFLFRNSRLSSKLKPARFHILFAALNLFSSKNVPAANSHDMRRLCEDIMEVLWVPTSCDELLLKSARAVFAAADGNLDRDDIRTQDFTLKVQSELKSASARASNWKEITLPPTSVNPSAEEDFWG